MTLDYKILWIDDREEFFTNHQDYLKEYLEEKGFEADIVTYKSYIEFEEKEGNIAHQKKYDLFLIDLNLDHGRTGDEIISKIRSNRILTDIIFYSTSLSDVRTKVNDNNIEGVFVTSRNQDDFEEKVTDVIDVTIKKVQDVNNLRGLIMAEVSELDRIKERIIVNATSKIDDRELEKYMLKKVKSSIDSNKNKLDEFNDNIDNLLITDLLNSRGLIDSDKKRLAVGKTLEKLSITEPIDKMTFLEPYKNNILTIRNNFAHVEESDGFDEDGNTCKLIGSIPFTEKKCIEIRQEIKKYKNILVKIEQKLNE